MADTAKRAAPKQHKTRLDRTFAKLVKAVNALKPQGGGNIVFRGVALKVAFEPGLPGLCKATINANGYDLQDNLQCKAELAADGLLGHDLRALGERCRQAVQERLHREKVRKAYLQVKALYGSHSRKVWEWADPERSLARSPKIAEAALAVLRYLEAHASIPASIAAARKAGINFKFLSSQEWKLVRRLAAYLANTNATKEKEDTND